MNKKNAFSLFLIGISFFSCNREKNPIIAISNIYTDFPSSEKLEFKPFNKYDILDIGSCMIDNSALWYFGNNEQTIGYCYDLNTGEKLSTIATIGRAANEVTNLETTIMMGDSLHIYTLPNTIKTFSKNDIIENIPMGERKFSVTTIPDSILVENTIKLQNGSVLATTQAGIMATYNHAEKEVNKKSIAVFNSKEVNSYETINYNSFDIEGGTGYSKEEINNLIKSYYSSSRISVRGNDMAVFSVDHQFMLYTFDINSGKVVNEKRYAKLQVEEKQSGNFFKMVRNDNSSVKTHLIS